MRSIRFERKLTLQAAAKLCGVGLSTLSKIETGQAAPAYGTLKRIAEGLELSFEELISGDRPEATSARRTITRERQILKFKSNRYDYRVHASDLASKVMVPLEMEIRARGLPNPSDWSQHDGEEFIFVLEGEIEVLLSDYAPFRLKQGQSAYIDSRMRHAFVACSPGPARMLSICYDPKHKLRTAGEFLDAALPARRSERSR
ncbi:helix-turn-helix domain-containing protein [Bradyrhizobium nitroreducens]|uniref:helix-turn-helix domain-containing protein n=1 Tax=Bradyrhizobium nitroreducens TaxID=709803 RepID=UPI0013751246|nr:XRE family transcriptional regulator [Bradyrhizobium nitroreducens]